MIIEKALFLQLLWGGYEGGCVYLQHFITACNHTSSCLLPYFNTTCHSHIQAFISSRFHIAVRVIAFSGLISLNMDCKFTAVLTTNSLPFILCILNIHQYSSHSSNIEGYEGGTQSNPKSRFVHLSESFWTKLPVPINLLHLFSIYS